MLGEVKDFEVRQIDAVATVIPAIDFNDLSHVFVLLPGLVPVADNVVTEAAPSAVAPEVLPPDPVVPRARALDEDVD